MAKTLTYNQAAQDWMNRPWSARRAAVMYPHLADDAAQAEMAAIRSHEGTSGPNDRGLLPDATRGVVSPLGGVAVRSGTQGQRR